MDHNYCFLYIDVGAYGKNGDAGIFWSSSLKCALDDNFLNFPPDCQLPRSETVSPYCIVTDEAFPLRTNLLKPYAQRNLDYEKKIFN